MENVHTHPKACRKDFSCHRWIEYPKIIMMTTRGVGRYNIESRAASTMDMPWQYAWEFDPDHLFPTATTTMVPVG
jgi:hypothetical protein